MGKGEGKGASSDVYVINIFKIDGRELYATLQPTFAGGVYLPYTNGCEALFTMFLWEFLDYDTSRRELQGFKELMKSSNAKEIPNWVPRTSINCLEITEWVYDQTKDLDETARNAFLEHSFDNWRAASEEDRRPYIEREKQSKIDEQAKWLTYIKENDIAPLAELSVDDICGPMDQFSWRYIQSVTLLSQEGLDEDQLNELTEEEQANAKVITGTYRIVLTDEKWLHHLPIRVGESIGTTAYSQPRSIKHKPKYSLEVHEDFPKAFRLRSLYLLMANARIEGENYLSWLPVRMKKTMPLDGKRIGAKT